MVLCVHNTYSFIKIPLEIKIKLRSFKSSEHISEKGVGPYRGFGYLNLFSDPIDLATWEPKRITVILHFSTALSTQRLVKPFGGQIYLNVG